MESINFFRGYGKVAHLEDQNHPKTTRKSLVVTLTVSAILFLTLAIGLMLAALIHESKTEPPEYPSLPSNSTDSIMAVCNVTQYPSACFISISSLSPPKKPDPETIFKISLQVSLNEVLNISAMLKTINDLPSQVALDDCRTLFEDALSQLNDSVSAMEMSKKGTLLTETKVKDIQTWISAAMTDQETCKDGLEEVESKLIDEVRNKMERSKEFLSNSLAIIANMHNLLEKFDLTMD